MQTNQFSLFHALGCYKCRCLRRFSGGAHVCTSVANWRTKFRKRVLIRGLSCTEMRIKTVSENACKLLGISQSLPASIATLIARIGLFIRRLPFISGNVFLFNINPFPELLRLTMVSSLTEELFLFCYDVMHAK